MQSTDLIRELRLSPHPEGGWYRENYRSQENVINRNGQSRSLCTSIYFLLKDDDLSCLHRIQSDEHWYFHSGQAIELVMICEEKLSRIILGNRPEKGETAWFTVPAGAWFGAKLIEGKGYALVSCAVSPGFDFADFELGKREELMKIFPGCKDVIQDYSF